MKSEKPAKPRHKLSFAVDREDIDTSTNWVDAVVLRPSPAAPAPAEREKSTFFVRPSKSATVERPATGTASATEAPSATGAQKATDAEKATVALFEGTHAATVVNNATVAQLATVAVPDRRAPVVAKQPHSTTVAFSTTVVTDTTVAGLPPGPRTFRLRPLRRITDGLTPGQFAVYSLMFEKAEAQAGRGSRFYQGGYVDLCRLTGLSKRGIQNAVAELLRKSVLSIHQAPGYHRTQTTVYEVPAEDAVMNTWFGMGFRYALGKSKTLVNLATVENNATV